MITVKRHFVAYVIVALFVVTCLAGCSNGANSGNSAADEEENVTKIVATTFKTTDTDSATVTASYKDFINAGFELGDSCNIEFENGYKLEDVPFYSGEYQLEGNPVILANDSTADVIIKNKNADFWTPAELFDSAKVTITLNTKARFKDTQDLYPAITVKEGNEGSDSEDTSEASEAEETDEEDPKSSSAGGPTGE